MNDSMKIKDPSPHIERYAWILAVVWTIVIAASLAWNAVQVHQSIIKQARIQVRLACDKDILYRQWNASHGGVYVPVRSETPPNPYLSHVPGRDVTTLSDTLLTLVNPAYMARQVNEMARKKDPKGPLTRITSLKPINPNNKADSWETKGLQAFEGGVKEASSVEEIEGRKYMRLLRPFITQEKCLKCHAVQGYKVGDIRGGISVMIPMEPLLSIEQRRIQEISLIHILIWLIGLFGGILGFRQVKLGEEERKRLEEEREKVILQLQDSLAKIKTLSGLLPICSSCKKVRDDRGYWTQIEAYISDHSEAEFSHGLCPECAKKLYPEYIDDIKRETN